MYLSLATNKRTPISSALLRPAHIWRILALGLLLIALLGPWTYERVYLPPPQECTAPNRQLEGDLYCGIPFSILWEAAGLLPWGGSALAGGDLGPGQWLTQLARTMLSLLLFLPFATTLPLIRSRRRGMAWRALDVVAWALAALAGVAYLRRGYFRPYPPPWGNVLYLGVSLAALAVSVGLLAGPHLRAKAVSSTTGSHGERAQQ